MIHRRYASPLGTLTLLAEPTGLVAVRWPDDDPAAGLDPAMERDRGGRMQGGRMQGGRIQDGTIQGGSSEREATEAVLDRAARQLEEYFAGRRREFDLPLAPRGTPFQLAAWEVLRTIPYGSTMTYRQQAAALGDPAKARAVGSANARNPLSIVVPCHRVCATGGGLGGFAGGVDAKAWLLAHEQRTAAATP